MSLMLAIKAFFKAFKDPASAEEFLLGKKEQKASEDFIMLAKLQQQGRLIDFFQEEISGYQDSDVGMCVRKIHHDCKKVLEEMIALEPIIAAEEGALYNVEPGYDPRSVKVVGNAGGAPPFKGIVRHKGWKAKGGAVLQPAEVEIR